MKSAVAKIFLVALPLVGLLMTAPTADACWREHHHYRYHPYAGQGWYYGNGYSNYGYYDRRGWDTNSYPSPYPYRPYQNPGYYTGSYPWWSVFFNR